MRTVLEVLAMSTEFLAGKGVESPRLNAELLVGQALGLPRMQLYLQFERPLSEAELSAARELVSRRGRREPLGYILGGAEFRGVRLKLDRRALVPRPETELLVETAASLLPAPPRRALDLGTGSGAIALALAAAWPQAEVVAVDASEDALALARENAASAGLAGRVSFLRSDWFSALPRGGSFGAIVANPPYLSEAEVAAAEPEVRDHEPRGALVAGREGMADLRAILAGARDFLEPGGLLALETGEGGHAELLGLAAQAGLSRAESRRDLAGRDRFILAWRD